MGLYTSHRTINSINTTDIAVASSPSADINGLTLIIMCQLFGFMKGLLQEAGISTDNTMILDNETIAQKERWMLSDIECSTYSWFPECVDNSMEYETISNWLTGFSYCITHHFMTDVGAKSSCYDDSTKPDNDTNDKNTMTLLSIDNLFYTFMEDTLDAGNTCQSRNDVVTLSPENCDWYIKYVRNYRAGSRCTYNTPSTDTDTELPYNYCLDYRLMKSLGADSVCKDWTLISMCSLFGFMKELLQEGGVSTDNIMMLDNDTIAQKERWLLSDDECDDYSRFSKHGECVGNSVDYVTDPELLYGFTSLHNNPFHD